MGQVRAYTLYEKKARALSRQESRAIDDWYACFRPTNRRKALRKLSDLAASARARAPRYAFEHNEGESSILCGKWNRGVCEVD